MTAEPRLPISLALSPQNARANRPNEHAYSQQFLTAEAMSEFRDRIAAAASGLRSTWED